jgi:hypothetical protein
MAAANVKDAKDAWSGPGTTPVYKTVGLPDVGSKYNCGRSRRDRLDVVPFVNVTVRL